MNKTLLIAGALESSRNYLRRAKALAGLVGFWAQGDTGATFADTSGNGYTGTWTGTISAKAQGWTGGLYAQYAQGFGSVYSAGFLSAFTPNEFSINLYGKPDVWTAAADQYLVHLYVDASNYIRLHQSAGGQLLFSWRAGAVSEVVTLGSDCWPSTWTMITVTASKSNNRIRMMINGEQGPFLQDTAAGTWAGSFGSTTCGFGGYRNNTWTSGFYGGLSNVAIYNREITEAEARTLLVRPLPVLAGIGDSIMQYTNRSSWIQGVAQTLGYRVANHGYAGSSIMGASHGMDAQTIEAASDGATRIILQHGVNDPSDAGITAKYAANIAALKLSNPAAAIYGMGILPNLGANAAARTANNARIATACSDQGIPYWDTDGLYDPTAGVGTSDGIHPNDAGARAIRDFVLARM